MHNFIDYSQLKTWTDCELKWIERYVHQIKRSPKEGQRDDALTLGSLVHEGLRQLRQTGKPVIPDAAIAAYMPTPECLAAAHSLLSGYVRAYPGEQSITKRYYCEEPLKFPLPCGWSGLAKIDSYFLVEQPTNLPDGLGSIVTLTPGWWVHEYKTKDASRDVGKYVMGWRMNMQPSFQMLALGEKIGEPIQGVLANVMERTKPYQPKRTCKNCREQHEFRNWSPARGLGEGAYLCPNCNHAQILDVPEAKITPPHRYYRLAVQRTAEVLAKDFAEINAVAERMQQVVAGAVPIRATERCVDSVWGPCEYFDPHSSHRDAADWQGFVQVEALKYVTQ